MPGRLLQFLRRSAARPYRRSVIRPSKEVVYIKYETVITLIIGIPTLMIAFAMLVLKIVEVTRSK